MSVGPLTLYGAALEDIVSGDIALAADDFSAILVTASYVPNFSTHGTYADVSANEASGTGYTSGGIDIGSFTVTRSGLTVNIDSSVALTWSASTLTAKWLVLVRRAGSSLVAGDRLLGALNLNTNGGSVSTSGGTLDITWSASGIYTFGPAT